MNALTSKLQVSALLFALVLVPGAAANDPDAAAPDVRPTIADGPLSAEPHFGDIAALVRDVIRRVHYSQPEFDSDLSSRTFETYLDMLDQNRSYLLASDVAEFERYRHAMVSRRGIPGLEPAYAMYNRLHERVLERSSHLESLLDSEPDFTVEETFLLDRSEAPWAESRAELDEITRKRFKNDALTLLLADKEWPEVVKTLERRYEGIARRARQAVADDVFQTYMNAFTTSIDPHTAYFTPAVQDNFRIDMSLSLEGIGAVLTTDDVYTKVSSIVPAGPAARSDALFPEDRIIGIAQGDDDEFTDVVGWRIDDVVKLVRGPKDTVVRLMVLPANAPPDAAPKVVRLVRKKVRLEEQAAQKSVIEVEVDGRSERIGVIELPAFYADFAALNAGDPEAKSTTRDVRRLLTELKSEGVKGVVMDLRGNGGGSLVEATDLAALFIGDGPVVQIRTGDGATQVSRNRDTPALYNGPLAVLIDRGSASGSEIFAGVIQDYGRGVIVGDRTYGKGTVQQLFPLDRFSRGSGPRLGELKVTIGKFYRVSGGSNQHRGIIPDLALPSPFGDNGYGESERPTALPWDEISPTTFPGRRDLDAELLELLNSGHVRRIEDDEAFDLLRAEFHDYADARSRKSVSLHRATRKIENEALQHERLERENARRELRGLEPVASLEALEGDDAADDSDLLLEEAARVVADLAEVMGRRDLVQARPVNPQGQ